MSESGQLSIDRGDWAFAGARTGGAGTGERAARNSLREQITRLEGELSAIVAGGFPYISPITRSGAAFPTVPGGDRVSELALAGPRVLSLEQLELLRDRLAARAQDLRHRETQIADYERQAHELLARMKLEPGRYKFVRLPVNDLGQGGCGVWEVRPRFGLIGMLAGWWQVKLSSGCPLDKGSRSTRGPSPRS